MERDPESRSEIDLRRKITIAWNWRLKNNKTASFQKEAMHTQVAL